MSPRKRNRRPAAVAEPVGVAAADDAAAPQAAHEPTREPATEPSSEPVPTAPRTRRPLRELGPLLLLRAAHPRQALVTALALAVAAALSDRAIREVGLVLLTVLVGQAIVGWHNDLVDRKRDEVNQTPGKPLGQGLLDPGTVWFALSCAALLVIPLALSSGVTAGSAYLLALVLGLMGNVSFRRGLLSWVTWAASFALYPAYLSYGGWGGDFEGRPPEITITVLAALLGICVHVLRALPGLVPDNRDGQRHLPLRIALRIGAPRLLWITVVLTALVIAGLLVEGTRVGLTQS